MFFRLIRDERTPYPAARTARSNRCPVHEPVLVGERGKIERRALVNASWRASPPADQVDNDHDQGDQQQNADEATQSRGTDEPQKTTTALFSDSSLRRRRRHLVDLHGRASYAKHIPIPLDRMTSVNDSSCGHLFDSARRAGGTSDWSIVIAHRHQPERCTELSKNRRELVRKPCAVQWVTGQ